ncbi:MAG: hypothetical protein ACYDAG_12665 [Chloroflexota bacterium]
MQDDDWKTEPKPEPSISAAVISQIQADLSRTPDLEASVMIFEIVDRSCNWVKSPGLAMRKWHMIQLALQSEARLSSTISDLLNRVQERMGIREIAPSREDCDTLNGIFLLKRDRQILRQLEDNMIRISMAARARTAAAKAAQAKE